MAMAITTIRTRAIKNKGGTYWGPFLKVSKT